MGNGASGIHYRKTSKKRRPSTASDEPIYRQALGRIAWLGDLYDATTDNFCKESVFRQPLPPDSPAISKIDSPSNETNYLYASSLQEKFSELKVTVELQLSILAGMCERGGSAKYLKQEKNSFGTVISRQLCHITTATERLQVCHDQVKNNISEKALRHRRATHVVIEIEWGADCVITAREQKQLIESTRNIQGRCGIGVPSKPIKAKIGLLGGKKKEEIEEQTETSVEILGDVLPNELPQDLKGANEMMGKIPELVKKCNDGKGRPLAYVMIPIFDLDRQLSDTPRQSIRTFISIDEDRTMNIVRLFDHATQLRQKVQKGMGSEADDSFEVHEAWAKYKLCRRVEKVRSGRKSVECLDRFCDRYSALLKSTMDRRGIHGDESWQEHSSSKYVSSDEVEFSSI